MLRQTNSDILAVTKKELELHTPLLSKEDYAKDSDILTKLYKEENDLFVGISRITVHTSNLSDHLEMPITSTTNIIIEKILNNLQINYPHLVKAIENLCLLEKNKDHHPDIIKEYKQFVLDLRTLLVAELRILKNRLTAQTFQSTPEALDKIFQPLIEITNVVDTKADNNALQEALLSYQINCTPLKTILNELKHANSSITFFNSLDKKIAALLATLSIHASKFTSVLSEVSEHSKNATPSFIENMQRNLGSLEDEVIDTQAVIKRLLKGKDELIKNVSHTLTPLVITLESVKQTLQQKNVALKTLGK